MDDDVRFVARHSIAANTQRTYKSAIKRYVEFCASHKLDPSARALTAESFRAWVAQLAVEGSLAPSTLTTYVAGVRTWWSTESGLNGASPLCDPFCDRVVLGAIKLAKRAASQRNDRRNAPSVLTGSMLLEMEPFFRSDASPFSLMILAAAMLGVHAALRPSELMGSRQHPERRLLASSIVFYAQRNSKAVVEPRTGYEDGVPDRFTVNLGATKTDQEGLKAPKPCAVPSAVRALWDWCKLRMRVGTTLPFLFVCDNEPLTLATLLSELERVHEQQGMGTIVLGGKSFRRGGTSGAAAAGIPTADLQAMGGWASAAMPSIYTTAEAAQERVFALGRLVPSRL